MRRRQMLRAIAADKGEGNAAGFQRVGDTTDRLTGKMRIKQRAMHLLPRDGPKRIGHRPGWTDYGEDFRSRALTPPGRPGRAGLAVSPSRCQYGFIAGSWGGLGLRPPGLFMTFSS